MKSTQIKYYKLVGGSEGSGQGRQDEREEAWFKLMDQYEGRSAAVQQPALQSIGDRTGKPWPGPIVCVNTGLILLHWTGLA